MNLEKMIDEIDETMLPSPYSEYAKIIGVNNLYKLSKEFGGTTIYIPKAESLFKTIRDKKIKEEYNGYNIQALARKYNVCEKTVRNICEKVNVVIKGQVSMFEEL